VPESFLISRHGSVLKIFAYSMREYDELFGGGDESDNFLAVMEVYWSDEDFLDPAEGVRALTLDVESLEEIIGLAPEHYQIDHERDFVLLKDWPADTPLRVKQKLETDFGPGAEDPWDFSS
jgi:hypothetical protein